MLTGFDDPVLRAEAQRAGAHYLVKPVHFSELLAKHHVPAEALSIELGERQSFDLPLAIRKELANVADMGVQLVLDDFGTGFASLETLTSLPISELKIDRSFVRDLGTTPQSTAVVSAIIALARALGLRVIAEGVEQVSQMEVLYNLGCQICQGFLFARPMPAHEINEWLRDQHLRPPMPRIDTDFCELTTNTPAALPLPVKGPQPS